MGGDAQPFSTRQRVVAPQSPCRATVAVSPLLYHVLQTALEAAESTDGAYDPTLQRQIADLGYDRSFDDVIAAEEHDGHLLELPAGDAERAMPGGGWRRIRLDRQRGEVTCPGM